MMPLYFIPGKSGASVRNAIKKGQLAALPFVFVSFFIP